MKIECTGPSDTQPCPTSATIEVGLALRRGWRKPDGERWCCKACAPARDVAVVEAAP